MPGCDHRGLGARPLEQHVGHQIAHAALPIGGEIKWLGQFPDDLGEEVSAFGFDDGRPRQHRRRRGDVIPDGEDTGARNHQSFAIPREIEPPQVLRILPGLRHHHPAHPFPFREQVMGMAAQHGKDIFL